MRLFTKIKAFLLLGFLLLMSAGALAEGIRPLLATALKLPDGQLTISTRFFVAFPPQLEDALEQGVPIYFDLSHALLKPSYVAYKFQFNQLFNSDSVIEYKLSYHPITNQYRVTVGTFSTDYLDLESALKAIGSVANWQILPKGALLKYAVKDVQVSGRLALSIRKLPKPFQINALTSKDWSLDSGWVILPVSGS